MNRLLPLPRPFRLPAIVAVLLVLLTGCATKPASSLPAVQDQVTARGGARVAWPITGEERAATDRAVAELLAHELTPESAVQVALLNNRTLRATFEELGVSEADVIAAGRLRNPTLAASVRWPEHKPRGPNVGLSLAADLLDNLLIPLRKKIVAGQLAQAERRVAHEVLALDADVRSAACTLQARQELRLRLAAIVEVNDAGADLAGRQYEAGNINRLELARLQLVAQQAKLELARAEAQVREDRERLHRLLGLAGAPTQWTLVAGLAPLPAGEISFAGLEELALRQRLDLAAAQWQIALAERALDLKRKTRLLPASVEVGAETERESDGGRLTGPSLALALPIFDQGQADLARLGAELRRATNAAEGLASDIRSEVRERRDALLAAREAAEFHAHTLLPQRRLLVRETLLHYNAMQKSNYELLAAREQELVAEREAIEAQRDYWLARVQLERAVGGRLAAAASESVSTERQPDLAR